LSIEGESIMKSMFAIVSAVLLCAASFAQGTPAEPTTTESQQPQTMHPGTPPPTEPQDSTAKPVPQAPAGANAAEATSKTKIAPGSVIPVELMKTVDAKKAKQGDEVMAKVTQDMKTPAGEVIVAKDTQVVGHVTEAQARNKEQKQSELGITFDRAKTKDGDMALPMSIQAVIAPPSSNPNPNAGYDQSAPSTTSPSPSATGTSERSPMGGGTPAPQQPTAMPSAGATDAPAPNSTRPPITGNTEGVIGIPNLKLEAAVAQSPAQGSLLTSEKGNVKLESGTFLLLRVNQ
jgi:hypothetical protein